MDAALLGRVWITDRLTGRIIMDEPVAARREAYWPGVEEAGWADGRVYGVLNILPFFYDSPWFSVGARWDTTYPPYNGPEWFPLIPIRMRETDNALMVGPSGRAYGAWSGAERAWQVNALVSDAPPRGHAWHGRAGHDRDHPCAALHGRHSDARV